MHRIAWSGSIVFLVLGLIAGIDARSVGLVDGRGIRQGGLAAAAPPVALGDPENPVPVGVEFPIGGDWFVTVPEPATDVSDGLPDGPPVDPVWSDQYRYLLIPVSLLYRGTLPIEFASTQILLDAESWEDHEYTTYAVNGFSCLPLGDIPDPIDLSAATNPTAAPIAGNVCVEISITDERTVFLRVTGPDSRSFYFALTPDLAIGTPTATPAAGKSSTARAKDAPFPRNTELSQWSASANSVEWSHGRMVGQRVLATWQGAHPAPREPRH